MEKIRVLLADDHAVLRAGLKALLNAEPDIEVIAEASDGLEAITKTQELCPDVLILDLSMPNYSGLKCAKELQNESKTRILVLTMHDEEQYLKEVLSAGVSGYLSKKVADTELLSAIRSVYRGENYIDQSMTKYLLRQATKEQELKKKGLSSKELSHRETDVLKLIALGYTNQEIADELVISIKSVETYKTRLMDKLELRRRSELVRYATEHGILSVND